jgi:N-carbamoyl-L-amino-acid hydrolase
VLEALGKVANEIAARREVKITTELINADPPTTCDTEILDALEDSARAAGKKFKRMVARAYHDSSFVSCFAPTAMLFIPCRGGVSHRPDEYSSPEWIGSGVHVLSRTLAALAS